MYLNEKSPTSDDMTLHKAALITGFGLLIMTIAAILAEFLARRSLIVPGDATITANNIMSHESLFRTGIISYLIVVVMDVVVAWALFYFLKPVNRNLSLLAGLLRMVYATIFAISLFNLVTVLSLLHGSEYLTALGMDQLHNQLMLSLKAFSDGWSVAFVFFGIHLILVGYLVFKSDYVPKILGLLLIVAGLGYLAENLGKFLSPNFHLTISIVTGWGEILFMFWLLTRGRNIQHAQAV